MVMREMVSPVVRFLNSLKLEFFPHSETPVLRGSLYSSYKFIEMCVRTFAPLFGSTVMVALTYRCQCKCEHCGSATYQRDRHRELKKGEVLELIDELGRLGAARIYFFGGEPLLVPELPEYVKYAKDRGLVTIVDTNGFLLDEKTVARLKEVGLDNIGVSIDSPDGAEHDRMRGVEGLFERASNGIRLCGEHGIRCYISTYATKDNLENGKLEELVKLARSYNVRVRVLSSILCGKWSGKRDVVLSEDEIKKLRSHLDKGRVYWEVEKVDWSGAKFYCAAFERGLVYVTAYGDVQPCCFMDKPSGNIRHEQLESIVKRMWGNGIFKGLREYDDCPLNYEPS